MIKSAAILTIGDELLLGQVLDTNSTWLSSRLTELGVRIGLRMVCPDDAEQIQNCIALLSREHDLVITTGGLGPTDDDKTVDAICTYLDVDKKRDPEAVERITTRLQSFLKKQLTPELLDLNLKQADIPENAIALDNPQGAAPGIFIELLDTYILALPGVPFEVKAIIDSSFLPQLRTMSRQEIHLYNIVVYNIAESALHLLLRDFEARLDSQTTLAYLPQTAYIVLRLTRRGDSEGFDGLCHELRMHSAEYFLTEGDDILAEVMHLLSQKNLTITTAESCTAGGLASHICDQPGASTVFDESLVSYANSVKIQKLGVDPKVIAHHGAVSEETVRAMSMGQLERSGADICIAISGILGPSGGSIDKPVGTTYIALAHDHEIQVKKIKGRWTRSINKKYVIDTALIMLIEHLRDQ